MPEKISYRIEASRKGSLTLIVERHGREMLLHSGVDPLRERDSTIESFNPEKYDTLIVLGLGLGYHLVPLQELAGAYNRIYFVDILPGIEVEIESVKETSFLRKLPNAMFLTGMESDEIDEVLSQSIDLDCTRGIFVLEHPASARHFPEYYDAVRKVVQRVIDRKAGNAATRKAFGRRYLSNILQNLPLIKNCGPVAHLFDSFKGIPAMVVTSGPSLDRYARDIYRHRDRAVIISVDSALGPLLKQGVVPDFVVAIDPQPYIYEHFQEADCGSTIPVLALSASPLLFRGTDFSTKDRRPRALVAFNSHPVCQVLESMGVDAGTIDSGTGTVAGDALCLAVKLGCSDICLAGFDFSFPGFSIYARGTAYQRRYGEYFQTRTRPVESSNASYIFNASKGFRRGEHLTRRSFVHYLEGLEEFMSGAGMDFFRAGSLGVDVKHATEVDPGKFFKDHDVIDKKKIMKEAPGRSPLLGDSIDFSSLREQLSGSAFFNELMSESLGEDVRTGRFRKLIERL